MEKETFNCLMEVTQDWHNSRKRNLIISLPQSREFFFIGQIFGENITIQCRYLCGNFGCTRNSFNFLDFDKTNIFFIHLSHWSLHSWNDQRLMNASFFLSQWSTSFKQKQLFCFKHNNFQIQLQILWTLTYLHFRYWSSSKGLEMKKYLFLCLSWCRLFSVFSRNCLFYWISGHVRMGVIW